MIDSEKSRRFGAAFLLLQGLVTALAPRISVGLVKKTIGKNFENASNLEAKPAYLRQLRAIGVGMVAAAGTDLLLSSAEETDGGPAETGRYDDAGDSEADGDDQ